MSTKKINKNKAAVLPNERLSPKDLVDESVEVIRQNSQYNNYGVAAPLNDIFFEEKSNPLSSKGN